jgi:menaquinol-cytochrome c reductase iron-sulfur subunit
MTKKTDDTPPESATPPSPELVQRRMMLGRMSIALSVLPAVGLGVPVVGFVVAPLLHTTPDLWRPVGKVSDFKVGETVAVKFMDSSPLPWAGVTAETAAWLRRSTETEFEAFSVNCAHLGCPVRWLPDAKLFMCPCHGGVYYQDGEVAAGPPPHALPRYPVRVLGDEVQVRAAPIPIG